MEQVSSFKKPTRVLSGLALAAGLGMALVPVVPVQAADVGSLCASFVSVMVGQAAVREELAMAPQRGPRLDREPGSPRIAPTPDRPMLDLNLSSLDRAVVAN